MNAPAIQAIVFDYGNTLVEFRHRQIGACDMAIADVLERLFGPLDREALRAVRDRDRMAPYAGDPPEYRENDLRTITPNMVRALYGREASEAEIAEIIRVRLETFVEVTEATFEVIGLLERLHARRRLGVLSNYPDGDAIRRSLRKTGLARHLDAVVVSGDVGFAKPHPLPFATILRELDLSPEQVLFVGDNWLADVQGAKRAGMPVVHTVQWTPYEVFDRNPADLEPDAVIGNLEELETLLV
ncbi:MAG: HAD family hydrolase [Candidatus Hydrogenedentes bacterium]|nr:HAD family hydrolase [Candidatus Hydrogenedentota bacterium]